MSDQLRLFTSQQETTTSDDHYTPKWVFDRLGVVFDIDVASPPQETAVPCKKYLTQADDGLSYEWKGIVWCNPPFSNTTPWVNKWMKHGNGLLLVPVVKSQWYYDLWDSDASICRADPDKSGIKFSHNGKDKRIMPNVVIAALGDQAVKALVKANFGKVR
jgi:phage N-6-adenine-methyltransferase